MEPTRLVRQQKEELVEVARGLLTGGQDRVVGCRRLVHLLAAIGLHEDKAFLELRGVESELEEFPRGEVRARTSRAYLARLDREEKRYLAEVEEVILAACQELVERLSVPQ